MGVGISAQILGLKEQCVNQIQWQDSTRRIVIQCRRDRRRKAVDPLTGKTVFVNKVVRFNHADLSSFCSLARIALGGFNQTFSILSQFLIAPDQRAGFRVRAAA